MISKHPTLARWYRHATISIRNQIITLYQRQIRINDAILYDEYRVLALAIYLFEEGEQICMQNVHSARSFVCLDHARDVNLTCTYFSLALPSPLSILSVYSFPIHLILRTLTYHLNINIILSQCTKHPPRNAHHILHFRSNQRQDGHLVQYTHFPTRLKCYSRLL